MSLRRIDHPANRGYGAALASAFDYALRHDFDVLVKGAPSGPRRFAYGEVERIKKDGPHVGLWIALGVTIGLHVPIGLCAAAA